MFYIADWTDIGVYDTEVIIVLVSREERVCDIVELITNSIGHIHILLLGSIVLCLKAIVDWYHAS